MAMTGMKRARQLTARKSVSIAEAGLSDVRRTDSWATQPSNCTSTYIAVLSGTIHVCHVCYTLYPCTSTYGYKAPWIDDSIVSGLLEVP